MHACIRTSGWLSLRLSPIDIQESAPLDHQLAGLRRIGKQDCRSIQRVLVVVEVCVLHQQVVGGRLNAAIVVVEVAVADGGNALVVGLRIQRQPNVAVGDVDIRQGERCHCSMQPDLQARSTLEHRGLPKIHANKPNRRNTIEQLAVCQSKQTLACHCSRRCLSTYVSRLVMRRLVIRY
jgi:hypothetical protein